MVTTRMMETSDLVVGDLSFEIQRSDRRRSLQITVERDGDLRLYAPTDCPTSTLTDFVREKRFWIYTKLAEKDLLRGPVRKKKFRSGEGFPYLGRSYRLLLVDEQPVPMKLDHGRFTLRRSDLPRARASFIRWYRDHAEPWLRRKVDEYAPRVRVEPGGITVRDLGYRWGSCGRGGRLYFHWKTILLPPRIVEYVVVHELIHLHEAHHTPAFWRRLERAMPDFEERKRWLAENGREAVGVF